MPSTEAQSTTEIERPRRARQRPPEEALLALVLKMVIEGKKPMDIARKASIPYPHAARLYEQAYERAWGRVELDYDPGVLQTMKRELVEGNLQTIRDCDRMVRLSFRQRKPTSKALNAKNAAIKIQATMLGFNAPTQVETTDRKVYAFLDRDVHARVMKDKAAREALMLLEEFAAAEMEGRVLTAPGPEPAPDPGPAEGGEA